MLYSRPTPNRTVVVRSILIFVLVVALVVTVLGLANLDGRADIDYLFGTWQDVSLLELFAIVAGLVIVVGVVAAVFASLHAKRDRHKLELELQQIYVRLRAAEAALPAGPDAALPVGPDAESEASVAPEVTAPDDAPAVEPTQEPADEPPQTAVADGDPVDPAVG